MMYKGEEAVARLIDASNEPDTGASSHWRAFHENFRVDSDGTITGVFGFGGCGKPYHRLRKVAHSILQSRFRVMGSRLMDFRGID